MSDLGEENQEFENFVMKISEQKLAYDQKLKIIQALETETTALEEDIENKTEYGDNLQDKLLTIQAQHSANNKDLHINNDELKYEYAKLDQEIEDIVSIIKAGRKKEIQLLEEVENEENKLRMLKDKGSALYLFLKGKNPGNTDLEIRLNKAVGQAYDEKLSKTLRKNIDLKAEKLKLQDMVRLMEEMKIDKKKEKLIARDDVDSQIDSFSMFGSQTNF